LEALRNPYFGCAVILPNIGAKNIGAKNIGAENIRKILILLLSEARFEKQFSSHSGIGKIY
jgi:hypothetical protein